MIKIVLLAVQSALLSLCLISHYSIAEPLRLTLAVNSPGTPPHLYFNNATQSYEGVIPDLLSMAEQDGALLIDYVDSHRNRSESFVYQGKLDMFFSSLQWVKSPRDIIATKPIFEHASFLYATEPFPEGFELNEQTEARVCTRRGFSYPTLDALFAHGKLKRIDSTSHKTMLNMLTLGRCSMAEINQENAMALQQKAPFSSLSLYRYDQPTSVVNGALLLHPSKEYARDIINQYIDKFINSGAFEASIRKHTSANKPKSSP